MCLDDVAGNFTPPRAPIAPTWPWFRDWQVVNLLKKQGLVGR